METLEQQFNSQVRAFLGCTGLRPTTFGMKALGDPNLCARSGAADSSSLRTADRVLAFLAGYDRESGWRGWPSHEVKADLFGHHGIGLMVSHRFRTHSRTRRSPHGHPSRLTASPVPSGLPRAPLKASLAEGGRTSISVSRCSASRWEMAYILRYCVNCQHRFAWMGMENLTKQFEQRHGGVTSAHAADAVGGRGARDRGPEVCGRCAAGPGPGALRFLSTELASRISEPTWRW